MQKMECSLWILNDEADQSDEYRSYNNSSIVDDGSIQNDEYRR